MDLFAAQQLALDLMDRHGLRESGWRFAWGHGKRLLGSAQVRRAVHRPTGRIIETKTLRLSRHLVRLNDDFEVRDTILHEIAHAIAGVENGHNHIWRKVCREIGARPQRLAGEEVVVVRGRYAVVCGCCGRLLGTRHRRMAVDRLKRTYCRHCGVKSQGQVRLEVSKKPGFPQTGGSS
ncbi:MAG: SprT-like domain-containing protein [Phycisphaeraceae bacterium]